MITDPRSSTFGAAPHRAPCLSRPDGFWSRPRCSAALLTSERGERLVVTGALEAASLPAFTAQVDQLMCTPCCTVQLDLSAVTSMDDSGMQAVLGLQSYVTGRGGGVSVTWPASRATATSSEATSAQDRHPPPVDQSLMRPFAAPH